MRQGGATLSHRMGEGLGVRAFRFGWYFQVAPEMSHVSGF
jgi:hypothetical protein